MEDELLMTTKVVLNEAVTALESAQYPHQYDEVRDTLDEWLEVLREKHKPEETNA